jgi:hypothetical protein
VNVVVNAQHDDPNLRHITPPSGGSIVITAVLRSCDTPPITDLLADRLAANVRHALASLDLS